MNGAESTLPIHLNVVIFKLRDFTFFFKEDNNDTQRRMPILNQRNEYEVIKGYSALRKSSKQLCFLRKE
jgi:hypothetical protein